MLGISPGRTGRSERRRRRDPQEKVDTRELDAHIPQDHVLHGQVDLPPGRPRRRSLVEELHLEAARRAGQLAGPEEVGPP